MVGQAEQGVAAHQREGHRLGGLGRDARGVEGLHGHAPQRGGQAFEQRGVAGAAAADQKPFRRASGSEVLLAGPAHGLHAEGHEGGHQVVGLPPGLAPLGGQGLRLGGSVALATRRLGRRAAQELVVQQPLEQRRVDPPAARARAIAVHALATAGLDANHAVDQRVGRAHVEGDDILGTGAARDPGQVGDAAQVENRPPLARLREGGEVKERRQGRPFASGGDVPRAEVGHGGAAGALGDHRGIADLERRPQLRVMGDRLAVGGDRVHRVERAAGQIGHRSRGLGEALAELDVERRQLSQRRAGLRAPGRQPVDALLELRGKGRLVEGQQREGPRRLALRPLDERRVHAVRRRSRHEPDHAHGRSLAASAARQRTQLSR